jgi:hypothetical protein
MRQREHVVSIQDLCRKMGEEETNLVDTGIVTFNGTFCECMTE